jgi:hypothetical protein
MEDKRPIPTWLGSSLKAENIRFMQGKPLDHRSKKVEAFLDASTFLAGRSGGRG